jgi:hypothetical protein
MHPPVDPWGAPIDPAADETESSSIYGRASVPKPTWSQATNDLPELRRGRRRRPEPVDTRALGRRAMSGQADRDPRPTPQAPMPRVSWQRAGLASRRKLFDGWGFTFAGLLILFCGWGVWAASGASGASIPPIVSLLFVVFAGAIVFAVLRLISRLVIEGMRHRRRPHARWAHFLTGTFLAVVGISYFIHNGFLGQGSTFVHQMLQRF